MDKQTVTTALRRDVLPLLSADGFTRRGDVARRSEGPVVHVVEILHQPRRGVFRVDLGVHVTLLGDAAGNAVDPAILRESVCAWRASIIPGFLDDVSPDFAYGSTEEEAAETVAFLASEWPRQSRGFFGPRSVWPGQFHELAEASLDDDVHPGHLLTYARVAALVGDPDLARTIASRALPRVPERATRLRDELADIVRDPSAVKPAR